MKATSTCLATLLLGASLSAASPALAQPAATRPSVDLRTLRPSADAESGLYYEPARSPESFEWNTALWLSYAHRPIVLLDAEGDVANAVIDHQLSGDLTFNLGFIERFALGVDIPFLLYQSGDEPDPLSQAAVGDAALPAQALGDAALLAKVTLIKPTSGDLGGFALAVHERFTLPTGDPASFIGEGDITSETRLLADFRYVAVSLHGALGVKLRAEEERFACAPLDAAAPEEDSCNSRFGHELPFGVGISFQPQSLGIDAEGRWTWFIESYGYVPLSPQAPFSNAALAAVQLGAGARYQLGADLSLLAGLDTALVGGIGTPPVRATLSLGWAPRKHDDDNDGIPNDIDACPEEFPEDHDGFEDEDGCPDWDNDNDGVPDSNDLCDGQQEDEDGFEDDDGCPDEDDDADGIADVVDACPRVRGIGSIDKQLNGCPDPDADLDGVLGAADRCPQAREDVDGHQDEDGCPDPDNDGDGIADEADSCPDLAGRRFHRQPEANGCPDGDDDGIVDGRDACPQQPGPANDDPAKHGCPAETKPSATPKPR